MSQDLLNTYKVGFDRTVRSNVEVQGGKLRQFAEVASGDLFRADGVYQFTTGGGLPAKVTNRFGDSPVSELDYSRRRVSRSSYNDGQFMDWADIAKMGVDVKPKKLTAMLNKFKRQEDIVLDQALLGTAQGGDNGETTVAFDTGNIIDVTLGAASGYTNAGFTYEKFLATLAMFGNNNVDLETKTPVFKISWSQWQDMMKDQNFINKDFTTAAPIDGQQAGIIKNYMGCKFVISNIVPYMNTAGTGFRIADSDLTPATGTWNDTDTTDVRAVTAFIANEAVLFEVNPDISTDIIKRGDKSLNWYAYVKGQFGAVRTQEALVNVIPCDQSPAAS